MRGFAAAVAALSGCASLPGAGGHYIWQTGESLREAAEGGGGRRAAVVLTETAAGRAEGDFMRMFTEGPQMCHSSWTDSSRHERAELRLALDEEGGSGALVSAPFVTSGEWTVEAECQYGLFGHSSSDEPPPLLTYYSSA